MDRGLFKMLESADKRTTHLKRTLDRVDSADGRPECLQRRVQRQRKLGTAVGKLVTGA